MRSGLGYIGVFCLMAGGCLALMSADSAPERLIIGGWEETNWVYEKVDLPKNGQPGGSPSQVERALGKGLVRHEAESWTFFPDHRLRIACPDGPKEARWHIMGRGHILRITNADGTTESYILDRLDADAMWLQFETDIQARGIARLKFKKDKAKQDGHAQEVQH